MHKTKLLANGKTEHTFGVKLTLAGTTFRNKDDSYRQDLIDLLEPKQKLYLSIDSDTPDAEAIAVSMDDKKKEEFKIGYLPNKKEEEKQVKRIIFEAMKDNYPRACKLVRRRGGLNGNYYGVDVMVSWKVIE